MISVIIPTYNVEDYIYICLNSVLKQTYTNFEIICIDDYSTDSTVEILEYYAKKDSRVKIIKNSENRGPGYSRNQGLKEAKGKYVFFLDSDDWLSPNAFELLHSKSEELDLDLLIYKAIVYYDNETNFGNEGMYDMDFMIKYENKVFNHLDLPSNEVFSISVAPWNKLYKKSFLDENNIRFSNENLIQEDNPFFYECILKAEKVSFLNKYLHNRNRHENSIMGSLGDKRLFDRLKIADLMIKLFLSNKEWYNRYKHNLFSGIVSNHLMNQAYDLIEDKYKEEMFIGVKNTFDKFYSYGLKDDILENVNKNILIKFEQIEPKPKNVIEELHENIIEEKNNNIIEKPKITENASNKYLTVDVGGTAIKYNIMDENIEIFEKGSIDTNKEDIFYSLDQVITPYLDQIDGIALSFPGLINVDEGIAHTGGSLKNISDLPLKSILEDKYKKKVWIENDGKCAALAELWKGNLKDVKSGVTIGLGTGIAGGIILNGELYRGVDGSAAEFSSILENFDNPNEASSWHQNGSYKGLIIPYAEAKGLNPNDIDGRKFFENYHNGDEDAIRVLNDYAKVVATGIINIQVILNVEKFCIGGGISSQDALINEIKSVIHDYFEIKSSKVFREPIVDRCLFENNAGCVGALYNFLRNENLLN